MNTPAAPRQGALAALYGAPRSAINQSLLALTAWLCTTAATTLPGKGEPPITPQTARSGGPIDPDQAKLAFDAADLSFEIFPEREAIAASATLSFTARGPLARVPIDLDRNYTIEAVRLNGRKLPASAWHNPDGRLIVTPPHRIAAGRHFTLRIDYGGQPHVAVRAPWDDGFVWSKTRDGRPWIASTTEGSGCDLLWPCLDFPTGEPGVVTQHITVPAGLKAPSNGVLLGVDTLADGRTRWNWRVKHPNTYAIALDIGPYEVIQGNYKSRFGNTIPMFYWHLPGEEEQAKALFAEFAPTLDFYESEIGPYPFGDEKVGVVETPHLGMEHQTINAYGNGYRKAPEGFDWLFQHEFGHEWFGNQVTAANWDDYWIHEGFEEYMQPLYGLWREGEARYAVMLDDQRNKIQNRAPIVSGTIKTEEQVYEDNKGGPGEDIYYKGAWMLHTLRWLIGDKAFFDATRMLVYGRIDPRPGNFAPRYGATADFERAVAQVTGRDYRWFFDIYLRQAALPDLIATRIGDRLDLRWSTPNGLPFPMPVDVQVGDHVERVAMADGSGALSVPVNAHVTIDPMSRILRRSVAVEQYQAWQADHRQRR